MNTGLRVSLLAGGRATAEPPSAGTPLAQVLSRYALAGQPAPGASNVATPPRRRKLAELDRHYHCSVIGTCLGTAVLRRLVCRHSTLDRQQATDLEIHHTAVQLAQEGGEAARALHKLLDEQHALALRRMAGTSDDAGLQALWAEALAAGEVPGAYWALMTHPQASLALVQRAFGDVHMLSHLVGAANRADIRRLQALERGQADWQARADDLQARLATLQQSRDQALGALQARITGLEQQLARQASTPTEHDPAAQERTLQDQARQLATLQARQARSSHEAAALQQQLADANGRLGRALEIIDGLHAELQALEAELPRPAADSAMPGVPASPLQRGLQGRRLLYVGGRPGSNQAIRRLVERAGGHWLHHDGGLEDRKGLLAASLPGADLVVFPVDCIDHDSMQLLKRLCARHQVAFRPLRSASLASFVAALAVADAAPPLANGAALRAPVCLRQG